MNMNKTFLSEAGLDKFIQKNLEVEQLIALSVTLNGKKYSKFLSPERLLKVYEKAVKGETIMSSAISEIFEDLKQQILKDMKKGKKS